VEVLLLGQAGLERDVPLLGMGGELVVVLSVGGELVLLLLDAVAHVYEGASLMDWVARLAVVGDLDLRVWREAAGAGRGEA